MTAASLPTEISISRDFGINIFSADISAIKTALSGIKTGLSLS